MNNFKEIKKTKKWRDELKETAAFKNKNGFTEVEKGVIDLVVALNILGIKTKSSCGGHSLEGNKKKHERRVKEGKIGFKGMMDRGEVTQEGDDYFIFLPNGRKVKLCEEYIKGEGYTPKPSAPYVSIKNDEGAKKRVEKYLDEFYFDRKLKDERLKIICSEFILELNSDDREFAGKHLKEIKKEFQDFAEYLALNKINN